jgi:predicted nucleic acid-binding protein
VYFLDTSALLKAYREEKGSHTVREAIRLLGRSVFVSDLVAIEALGIFVKRLRGQEITEDEYLNLYQQLQQQLQQVFYVVPVESTILERAYRRVHLYRDRKAGTLDHIHVSTAEYLQSLYPTENVRIMCSDEGLSFIAGKLGFEVFDPEIDPLSKLDLTPLSFPRLLT